MSFRLIIQSNSPGELSTWVMPIVAAFRRLCTDGEVIVCLTPCQYASGKEKEIAEKIDGVTCVYSPKETIRLLLSWPFRDRELKKGAVLYLGGDPMYSRFLSYRFGVPAFAYTEHKASPGKFFKRVFYKHLDGDLMASQVAGFYSSREEVLKKYQLEDRCYVLFFTGSRPHHVINYVSIIAEAVAEICKRDPLFSPLFLLSPFVDPGIMKEYPELNWVIGDSLELMSIASLLVTLPGSNTALAMYMGLPTLMFVPLHKPEFLQFDGALGLLSNLPVVGLKLKQFLMSAFAKQHRFIALPNKHFNREVIPEIIGSPSAEEMADSILDLYHDEDRLKKMRATLETAKPSLHLAQAMVSALYKT
ncbi:MAG: hypothetical protein EXS67_00060 [Candidatus Margulisbacteria bacterium]|nr:hypothetical protein [Candidatus Margulisiibacteriota bacterium]